MKKGERKKPDIYYDPFARLSPEEKARLRNILVDPVYVKLLRVVEGFKPSANCTNGGSGTRDAYSDARANARLGEIRGWEFHIAAIYRALADVPATKTEAEATYPNTGAMNLEPQLPKQ